MSPSGIHHNTTRTEIRFVNRTKAPVVIKWVNFQGILETYDSGLRPMAIRNQNTYVGHEWVMLPPQGKELGRVFATPPPILWEIAADGVKRAPRK